MKEDTPEATLQGQLDKPPEDSKKYAMTRFGVYTVLSVFGTSALLFVFKADTAGHIVVLAQITVGAIAGLVGIYCGAQGFVEMKASSSLASVVESKKSENKTITVDESAPNSNLREHQE